MASSRWLSREFMFYYVYAFIGYAYNFYLMINRAERMLPHDFFKFARKPLASLLITSFAVYNSGKERIRGLEEGWLFSRKEDVSDLQWNAWRQSFPLLFVFLSFFVTISQTIHYFLSIYTTCNMNNGDGNTELNDGNGKFNHNSPKQTRFQITPSTNKSEISFFNRHPTTLE